MKDIAEALTAAVAAGATVAEPPSRGENDIRTAFRDPDGHLF